LLGGFPSEIAWALWRDVQPGILMCLAFTTVWWLYLMKSQRVAAIFSDLPRSI